MKYDFLVNSSRGTQLHVIQQLPDKGDKFPTVLLVPGFGVDMHEYGLYDEISTMLVKHGIQTWSFSFAGTGKSTGDFSQTTLEDEVQQLHDMLAAVRKDRFTDLERIGIAAHAFGAAVVIAGLPYADVQSLLFMSPMANPYEDISKMYKRQRSFNPTTVSAIERPNKDKTPIGPRFWKSLTHYNLVSMSRQVTQPTLLIHGSKNFKVKMNEIGQYFNALTAPKKVQIIEKADHGYTRGFRRKLLELVAEWFEETLLELE